MTESTVKSSLPTCEQSGRLLTLTLVRHGSTLMNGERRYQGHADPPLSGQGESEARALREQLRAMVDSGGAAVHTSDLRRARQTAALALPGVAAIREPRLRELDFGAFDGGTHEENMAKFGDHFRRWIADPAHVRPPGGETLGELETRVIAWLRALDQADHVLAFTHSGPIRVVIALAERIPFREVRSQPIAPGTVVRCVLAGDRLCGALS